MSKIVNHDSSYGIGAFKDEIIKREKGIREALREWTTTLPESRLYYTSFPWAKTPHSPPPSHAESILRKPVNNMPLLLLHGRAQDGWFGRACGDTRVSRTTNATPAILIPLSNSTIVGFGVKCQVFS